MKQEQNKYANHKVDALYKIWLGLSYLFQTFEDLESVRDKLPDIKAIQKILNERTL